MLSEPKRQITQLAPIIPQLVQKRRQSTPVGVRSALMGSPRKVRKPNTCWHKPAEGPLPPPSRWRVQNACAKAAHGHVLASAIVLRGKCKRSDPGHPPPYYHHISYKQTHPIAHPGASLTAFLQQSTRRRTSTCCRQLPRICPFRLLDCRTCPICEGECGRSLHSHCRKLGSYLH
jgi:hypothetical protein